MEPWPNSYLRSSALDDPLDNPVLQRDSARDLALLLEERNEKALRLHARVPGRSGMPDWCEYEQDAYPCATVRALTGTDEDEVA